MVLNSHGKPEDRLIKGSQFRKYIDYRKPTFVVVNETMRSNIHNIPTTLLEPLYHGIPIAAIKPKGGRGRGGGGEDEVLPFERAGERNEFPWQD